jgi:hypothetical protein
MGSGKMSERESKKSHRDVRDASPSSQASDGTDTSEKGMSEAIRIPVDYRYDAINPTFLKMLARIGSYADQKYGAWEQYTRKRLVGEKSPVNHIQEHLRAYVTGEPYDHFDGDPRWHLAAIAYNAMMAYFYHSKWGPEIHPLTVRREFNDDADDGDLEDGK